MEHSTTAVTPKSPRVRRWFRFLGRLLIAAFAICLMLAIDFSPDAPVGKAPTAEQARRVRDLASRTQMMLQAGKGTASVWADQTDMRSAAALANALGKFGRVDARIEGKALVLQLSRAFGPVWLNGKATISSSTKGFPETWFKIGNLTLGPRLSRWIIEKGRIIARHRGVEVPPLDDLVHSVQVNPNTVSATIHLPLRGKFANSLSDLRTKPVDAATAAAIYCTLVTQNRTSPTDDLAIVVRRAFASTESTLTVTEQNRARFVALAMYATNTSAGRLAGDAANRVRACRAPILVPQLAGRRDLASHWALSAALAASLGDDVGRAMGEWKELSDSRPGGSGFSFVDLAADRAGLDAARRATDPLTAAQFAAQMQTITGQQLLPIRALALSEGLSERDFVSNYRAIDSAAFEAAKARIDAVLAKN